jgi:hypothetical protein
MALIGISVFTVLTLIVLNEGLSVNLDAPCVSIKTDVFSFELKAGIVYFVVAFSLVVAACAYCGVSF